MCLKARQILGCITCTELEEFDASCGFCTHLQSYWTGSVRGQIHQPQSKTASDVDAFWVVSRPCHSASLILTQ